MQVILKCYSITQSYQLVFLKNLDNCMRQSKYHYLLEHIQITM
jgi:hypothetical protein